MVSSRPRPPGVRRPTPKRAVRSATAEAGRPITRHAGPATRMTRRHPGRSRRCSSHSRTRRRFSGSRRSCTSATNAADHHDHRREREQAARDVGRQLVERVPEDVAERGEGRRPGAGAEHVVGQEPAQRHPARAGDERRQRADEADEAADQDRRAAALLEEALDLREPVLGDLQPLAVAQQPRPPEPAPQRVGRQVTGDRARPHDADQDEQRDLALAGHHAADDHRRLARRDEADERAGLEEGEHADDQVGPRPERAADLSGTAPRGSGNSTIPTPMTAAPATTSQPPSCVQRPSLPAAGDQEAPPAPARPASQPHFMPRAPGRTPRRPARRRSRRGCRARASRAASGVPKTANTVGPEPDTIAPGEARERRRSPGTATARRPGGR